MKTFIFIPFSFSLYYINCLLPFINIILENGSVNSTKLTTYIYGHINPDSDAIISPLVLADYMKKMGSPNNIIPCRLGNLNKESTYILNFFKVKEPLLITDLSNADEVILVDHNAPPQSLDFHNANIVGLIDHHAITGFETTDPIEIITRPVGCTCTILYQLYRQNNVTISKEIAGLIVSAIISDTLLLKSAITTKEDIEVVEYLSNYIDMNYKNFGYDLLKAGTDVSDLSESKIINLDSKAYKVNGYMIQIAFLNSIDVDEVLKRKEKLLNEINRFIDSKNVQLFVLVIVDINVMDSTILVSGKFDKVVETAFNVTIIDNEAFLKGITSRKKEVYPSIAKVLNEMKEYEEYGESNWIHLNFILILALISFI